MIKLKLDRANNTLSYIRQTPGLDELNIDTDYGVVTIDPKKGLYVIRVIGEIDMEKVRALNIVQEVYGDLRVAPFNKDN